VAFGMLHPSVCGVHCLSSLLTGVISRLHSSTSTGSSQNVCKALTETKPIGARSLSVKPGEPLWVGQRMILLAQSHNRRLS
jgi:hypothetical protein